MGYELVTLRAVQSKLLSVQSFSVSVCGARTSRRDSPREEDQRCANQASPAQKPEAIEKAEKSRLLLKDSRQLGFRMQCGIRGSEAVHRKISRQCSECFLITLLDWGGMSN